MDEYDDIKNLTKIAKTFIEDGNRRRRSRNDNDKL